jgi:hypothetical protein
LHTFTCAPPFAPDATNDRFAHVKGDLTVSSPPSPPFAPQSTRSATGHFFARSSGTYISIISVYSSSSVFRTHLSSFNSKAYTNPPHPSYLPATKQYQHHHSNMKFVASAMVFAVLLSTCTVFAGHVDLCPLGQKCKGHNGALKCGKCSQAVISLATILMHLIGKNGHHQDAIFTCQDGCWLMVAGGPCGGKCK